MANDRGIKNMKRLLSTLCIAVSVFLAYGVSALFFNGDIRVTMVAVIIFAVIGGIISSRVEERIDARYGTGKSGDDE